MALTVILGVGEVPTIEVQGATVPATQESRALPSGAPPGERRRGRCLGAGLHADPSVQVEDAVLDTFDLVFEQALRSSSSARRQELVAIQDTVSGRGCSSAAPGGPRSRKRSQGVPRQPDWARCCAGVPGHRAPTSQGQDFSSRPSALNRAAAELAGSRAEGKSPPSKQEELQAPDGTAQSRAPRGAGPVRLAWALAGVSGALLFLWEATGR